MEGKYTDLHNGHPLVVYSRQIDCSNLIILLLMGGQADSLVLDLASKAIKELTDLYTAAAATVTTSM